MNSSSNPKVSVIIPAYNAEQYINQALESVINQTEQDFEVIVCDDQSSDNTAVVVHKMAKFDNRIKLIKNEQNKGPSYSRNLAIKNAKGKWIAILDADDFYHPERLDKLIKVSESNNAELVADNLFYVNIEGKYPKLALTSNNILESLTLLSTEVFIANRFAYKTNFKYGYLKPLILRSFIVKHKIEYDENVRVGEDFMFYVECLLKGANFLLTKNAYYYYREVNDSLSRNKDNNVYNLILNNNSKLINIAKSVNDDRIVAQLKKRENYLNSIIIFNKTVGHVKKRKYSLAIKELIFHPLTWKICLTRAQQYLKKVRMEP